MVFATSTTAFAAEQPVDSDATTVYTLVQTTESAYGTVYYVKDQHGIQTRTIWDVVDVLMAGAAWAKLFNEPSWGNFGWAVLDTAAILPVLPSTAYFRQGGKVLLKADEVAKFAKTSKGKKAIEAAMKTYKYSDGITTKAVKDIKKTFRGQKQRKFYSYLKMLQIKGWLERQELLESNR